MGRKPDWRVKMPSINALESRRLAVWLAAILALVIPYPGLAGLRLGGTLDFGVGGSALRTAANWVGRVTCRNNRRSGRYRLISHYLNIIRRQLPKRELHPTMPAYRPTARPP
jgi:hypothetical protein